MVLPSIQIEENSMTETDISKLFGQKKKSGSRNSPNRAKNSRLYATSEKSSADLNTSAGGTEARLHKAERTQLTQNIWY